MSNNRKLNEVRSAKRLILRSSEALLGICQGIMADNQLNNEEIDFLQCWLEEHSDITDTFPADVLIANIKEALADGHISEHERNNIIHIIKAIIGGTMQETGATSGLSTTLPLNHDAKVAIDDNIFSFTGTFKAGNRKHIESLTVDAGGSIAKGVNKQLNFLVIGEVATTSWVNTSFGRKIEKAVSYQKNGQHLYIINEDMWASALNNQ